MKKLILKISIPLLLSTNTFAYSPKIIAAHAVGIFDEKGDGENIQHVKKSKHDYNGTCYSKIVVIGKLFGTKPKVNIGDSIGHFEKSIAIYSTNKTKIGEEITYKHYNVKKGYLELRIFNKLYDSKVFIK